MNAKRYKIAGMGLSWVLMCLLLAGMAGASYKNRILISANLGGAVENADYRMHGCLGQNVVSDWLGRDSSQTVTGIMHFSELYSWMLPVMDETLPNVLPREFALYQNFPNPFNPETTIRYDLPRSVLVNISIYNTCGQRVAVLVDGPRQPGRHEVIWDAAGISSGVYFYRIQAGDFADLKKLMLIK